MNKIKMEITKEEREEIENDLRNLFRLYYLKYRINIRNVRIIYDKEDNNLIDHISLSYEHK